MTEKERFEFTMNDNGQAGIIDWVESKEKNAFCIYTDLGALPFTSAKAVCNKLNEQEEEIKRLKDELFEARKDYIVDTADISDKPYLDEMIEEDQYELKQCKGDDDRKPDGNLDEL